MVPTGMHYGTPYIYESHVVYNKGYLIKSQYPIDDNFRFMLGRKQDIMLHIVSKCLFLFLTNHLFKRNY